MWLLLLLATMVGLFALNAHVEALQASAQRQRIALEYAAEAGIEVSAARLLAVDSRRRPIADGRSYRFAFDEGIEIEVAIRDESGKVDLNVAAPELLQGLFVQAGLEPEAALVLALAVIDWRDGDLLVAPGGGAEAGEYRQAGLAYGPANRAFQEVSELRRVLGMNSALFARLQPDLTVHTGLPVPTPGFASPTVLRAMGLPAEQVEQIVAARAAWWPGQAAPVLPGGLILAATGSGTYSISSRAFRADGPEAVLHATVRLGAAGFLGQVYTPLAWRHGQQD